MPSNLYGVSNCPGIPLSGTFQGSSGNLACPANVETNVIVSAPLIAPSQGYFYCAITGVMGVLLGATPPTFLTIAVKFTTGSDFTNYVVPTGMLVANAEIVTPVTFYSPALTTNWLAPGSIVNVTVLPQGQAIQALSGTAYSYFALIRAPDQ